jgi:hypothetical protein
MTISQAGACWTHVAWILARPKGKSEMSARGKCQSRPGDSRRDDDAFGH